MSDYNAGIQNWSIAQDERGVMYFGNNNGLLEFDGSAWRLYELPTKGIVRAIYISKDGRIYVGSYEEFGYFVRTPYNTLEYHSLKDEVKDFTFHNDEIWNIVCVQGEIVFQSFGSLFLTSDKTPALAQERLKRRSALSSDSFSFTLISAIISSLPPSIIQHLEVKKILLEQLY